MLELKHLEKVAATFRNLATTAPTDETKAEMLAAAEEYQRRADVRRKSLETVKSIGARDDS